MYAKTCQGRKIKSQMGLLSQAYFPAYHHTSHMRMYKKKHLADGPAASHFLKILSLGVQISPTEPH